MPRLSLYRPTKMNDYKFLDRTVREQFWVGGTEVHVHKYVGPAVTETVGDKSQPNYVDGREVDPFSGEVINTDGIINETKIQDLLFMENRDRKYESCIYDLRGVYNVQDNDFDLTQFGMFLSNDMLYITFHINEMIEILGRKLLPGDVLELPHLRDEFLLDAEKCRVANKYYVITDANRGAEGFSPTWYPHIWRVKVTPLTDSQEYYDILGKAGAETLKDDISTYKSEFNISDAIVGAATDEDPDCIPLTDHLFGFDHPTVGGMVTQDRSWDYGETIQQGDQFPQNPQQGQYFIRNDFVPVRMFVRNGSKWNRVYDHIENNKWAHCTYNASDYIFDDTSTSIVGDDEFTQRQPLSEVIRPLPDNELSTAYVNSGYVSDDYVEE